MAGVFINSSQAVYATAAESLDNIEAELAALQLEVDNLTSTVETLQSQVDTIQNQVDTLDVSITNLQIQLDNLEPRVDANTASLVPNMVQFYKNTNTPVSVSILPFTFTVVTGYEISAPYIPGSFTNPSPGILQCNAASSAFYQINYMIACNAASGAFDILLYIYINNTPYAASKQINNLDSSFINNVKSISGTLLAPLSPNDTISLRANFDGAVSPVTLDVYTISMAIQKIPSI